jgi:autotransporter-associated beta strand protein
VTSTQAATNRFWTGAAAGVNASWTAASNWSNSVAPLAGDALVFPTNVAKLQVTNDFAANTDFDSLTLRDSYILRGNAVDLSNGVAVATIGTAATIDLSLRLLTNCQFDVDDQAQLSITNLNLNGRRAAMQGDGDITVNGAISGTGAASELTKSGAGTLRLNRVNTYAGQTTVSNGSIVVNGLIASLSLLNGTTLSGTGTVGSLSVAGTTTIAPGDAGIGILSVAGAMALNGTTTLQLTMNDRTPGVTLDQLRCSGSINLNSAKLSITKAPGLLPIATTEFVILSNTTASAISGTFAGLPEGAVTNIGGVEFQISYVGGTGGNDVTLTAVPVARSWDGGGIANTNWSNPANWSANTLPQPEDILLFPPNVPGRTNFADFTNGFPVHHITIGQSNYVIQGTNELVLRSYFEATNTSGAVDFFPPLRASSNPTIISNLAGGTLNLNGAVRLTGAVGVFAPQGTMVVNGPISASQITFKRSPGMLRLANSNAIGLSFQIEEGTVQMLHDRALNPVASPVAVFPGARLELLNGRILSNALSLAGTLFGGGSGASNRVAGQISLDAPATIDVASNSWLTFAANVVNTNGLTKVGQGTLELNATHNYTGTTLVNSGTLLLTGSAAGSKTTVNTNGTLAGSGTIGSLTNRAGGTVIVGRTNVPGRLTVIDGATLSAGSAARFRIDGAGAGSGYSQITVNGGAVALNNATLNLTVNFAPAPASSFVLIDNAGAGATTGTFAGLPQGATFMNGGTVFQISYTGGTGNDVVLTVPSGSSGPTNLRLHSLGPRPNEISVRWDPPSSGPMPAYYIVYRNGLDVARLDASLFIIFPVFYDPAATAGHTYTYQVVAEYGDGSFSAPTNPFMVTALPPAPYLGTNNVVTILARFPEYPVDPFPPSQPQAIMFTGTNSIRAYLEEVSYGKFSITGSVHGWFTLPYPASNYCATLTNGLWRFCDDAQILDNLYATVPLSVSNAMATANVLQLIVHGRGTMEEVGASVAIYSASNDFVPKAITHQLGHSLGFFHASTLTNCTGYPLGPDLVHLRTNNCSPFLYGDIYDPMGASEVFHYNAFFKETAGWLGSNNIQWVTNDGDYTLQPLEKKTNAIQVLKIDLGGEMFWFLEYRTITGFDGPTVTNRGIPSVNGVLMRLRVTRYLEEDSDTYWVSPVIRTNTPWFDPFSGLCVNLLNTNNGIATVRITGLSYLFRATDVKRTGADLKLTWNSVPGARYLVQGKTNAAPWTTLATSFDATSRVSTITLTNAATNTYRFFRVGVDTGP